MRMQPLMVNFPPAEAKVSVLIFKMIFEIMHLKHMAESLGSVGIFAYPNSCVCISQILGLLRRPAAPPAGKWD